MVQMVREEEKLKKKINLLIDRVQELDNEVSEKNARKNLLQEEIRMLEMQVNQQAPQISLDTEDGQSEVFFFLQDFCKVARRILSNEDYIKYTYETKNSPFYYKIEQSVFENYICEFAKTDLKTFLDYCVDFALIKAEKNRKRVYASAEIRVYYVSRKFMDAAKG